MTTTVRKCDFCEQDIPATRYSRTVMVLKSHRKCGKRLSDVGFDICDNCMTKMLDFLYDSVKIKKSNEEYYVRDSDLPKDLA